MAIRPRLQGLDVGVTDIHRWRVQDEVHLPETGARPAPFLPQSQPLDAILRRQTLDERLVQHLIPRQLDPELLAPAVLSQARHDLKARFEQAAAEAAGERETALRAAAALLEGECGLDQEVQLALAALLRG